jgi:hypothetical protein
VDWDWNISIYSFLSRFFSVLSGNEVLLGFTGGLTLTNTKYVDYVLENSLKDKIYNYVEIKNRVEQTIK